MFSPLVISNELIRKAQNEKIKLTPLKLQKLLFLVYGRYYSEQNARIFLEPFCVWKYGPVLESVYYEFQGFGGYAITEYAKDAKGDAYFINDDNPDNNALFTSLANTWNRYKNESANVLVGITHSEPSPWTRANNEHMLIIPDEYIKPFFDEYDV
jgi:uncharacterized phage-associated protein